MADAKTEATIAKALRVKVNVLKRVLKDLEYAEKELKQEQARLETTKEKKDDFLLRQQKQVVEETKAMVPDAKRRIASAVSDLQDFLKKEKVEADLSELLDEANAYLVKAGAAPPQAADAAEGDEGEDSGYE
eukprot:Sspe_Gene.116689::Locus_106377_Transcript_1_1_Confidence_1.000_Length_494::g.116689::m.116689/K17292/TBCA; tubulin-specific chaperone A